jgi:cobalamin-dependent methionine synthase I
VGEQHELAALALAIQLSLEGYRVSYLGPNLPADELVKFCATQRVQLLCVSLINSVTPGEVVEYLRVFSSSKQLKGTRIVLGGAPLEGLELGATGGVEIVPHWEDLRA